MNIRDHVAQVVDNIRKRGVRITADVVLSELGSRWFDMRFGTNTARWVQLDDLQINSENKSRGVHYEPSRPRPFKKLMDNLDFPSDSVLVDFGSGKGRVLLMASEYCFKRIVGVEFSHELCQEAKKNIAIYKKKVDFDMDIEVHESDVVHYAIKDDENIFFIFQPFDSIVLGRVLENIEKSLAKEPRDIWLLYHAPHTLWASAPIRNVVKSHGFQKEGEYVVAGDKFFVYVRHN